MHFYKQGCAYIHYFCTCDKILIFTNGLWVSHSIVHSDGDPMVTSSAFHSITQKGVTAHPSFLIITLIHLPTIASLVPLASRPLLWLGLGL